MRPRHLSLVLAGAIACGDEPAPTATKSLAAVWMTPAAGDVAGGTIVTIEGTGFSVPVTVTFGGVRATDVVVVSGTTLRVVAPEHAAGQVEVVVTAANGRSATVNTLFRYFVDDTGVGPWDY